MNADLERAWKEAAENPGTPVDIGRAVVCDLCSADFTDSSALGGFLFESKGVCPTCAPRFRRQIEECGEEELIRATCPPGVSFGDFIRGIRGDNNSITIHSRPKCRSCKQPFTDKNVHSNAGWAETRISGTCEDCFDKMFEGCE